MSEVRAKSGAGLLWIQRYQSLIGLVLLLIVAWRLQPLFFSGTNLANILNQLAIPGTLALGMTFVILTGGIDLSVGSHFALLNCVVASWCKSGAPLWQTVPYVLLLGTGVGALTGGVVSWSGLQPFVVTLGAMVSLRGIAYVYSDHAFIAIRDGGGANPLEPLKGEWLGLPYSAYALLAGTMIAWVVLTRTRFGRQIYAIGGNTVASHLSGVPVNRVRIGAYAINGLCVGISALIFTAKTDNGQFSAGMGYELDAIAGAVVGGCSLMGGYGSVLGTFVGALFIVAVGVLLQLMSVDKLVGDGFKGIIILLAVYLQNLGRRKNDAV